jgi:bile acid-coenzyme A ligase
MQNTTESRAPISYGRRLSMLAAEHPDKPALIFSPVEGAERIVTWGELDRASNRAARLFADRGVDDRSLVVVGLPNGPEHYVATFAAWKLGALVLPLKATLPGRERDQILETGAPALVVADWEGIAFPLLTVADLRRADEYSNAPLPDVVPHPGKSIGSGGSTGRSKIIVDPKPLARVPLGPGEVGNAGLRNGQVQLIAGPLYHNSPFSWGHFGLFEDHTLVLMERFDAARALDLIERHRVNFAFLAPTMMKRMIEVPGVHARDLSSIEAIFQTAAPCPPWLKRAWIALIGGEKLHEGFGSTEAIGHTNIRGDEWLRHPGSVGRPPADCELRILDEDFREVPQGEVGEIFFRLRDPEPTYYYIGSPPVKTSPDGFKSVGDMGWVDEDSYLYLADRRVDLIISGGANVYPAEVEAALTEHPGVSDVAVIGLPDADMGKTVHAVVQPRDPANPPAVADLDVHCRKRLASYKVPRSYEFVDGLPRDDTGKIRRSAMAAERADGAWPGILRVPRGVGVRGGV